MQSVVLLVCIGLLMSYEAGATRVLLDSGSCGAAGSPCGASLQASCHPSGVGFCQPGHFCGWTFSDTNKQTTCMPVPKNCGQSGQSCCPGNANAAIADSKVTPKPTCADGAYCFYTPTPDASGWSSPAYSSPAGSLLGTCRVVDKQCGTSAGKACCPSLYHVAVNPVLPDSITKSANLCSGSMFCKTTSTMDASGKYWPQGVCQENKSDCGKFGKSCCIQTSGVSTNFQCGASYGQPGAKGYCSYPGGKPTGDMRDQVCTECPAASVVAASPSKYFGCSSV